MRIVITGATGFIGHHLCRFLLAQGHTVHIYSRSLKRATKRCPGALVFSAWPQLPVDFVCDAVINLSGEPVVGPRWTKARKAILWQSRIGVTRDMVDWLAGLQQRPEVLISGSAVGVYGQQGDSVLTEDSTPTDTEDFSRDLCIAWEAEAQKAEALGIRVCRIRTGLVLGNDGGLLQRLLPVFRLGLGGRLGAGNQWMPWIHLDDYLAILQLLLEHRQLSGAFNAAAPEPVTNAVFTDALAATLDRRALLPLPACLLKWLMGEMADLLLGGQRAVPKAILSAGYVFRYPNLRPALRQLLADV